MRPQPFDQLASEWHEGGFQSHATHSPSDSVVSSPASAREPNIVYCDESVCLSVCLSVRSHISTRSSAIAEGPRDASCQVKSCQLPRNDAETTRTISPERIEVMKLEADSGPMCNKHVHATMTRYSRFHCPIGVINKPTTDELWISPVYLGQYFILAAFSNSVQ